MASRSMYTWYLLNTKIFNFFKFSLSKANYFPPFPFPQKKSNSSTNLKKKKEKKRQSINKPNFPETYKDNKT